MNVVMTGAGELVEVQGTAEHRTFSREQLSTLLDLADGAVSQIVALQRATLSTPPAPRVR